MPNGNARLTTHARALLVARQAHPYRCEETQPHPRQRRLASPRPIRDRKTRSGSTTSMPLSMTTPDSLISVSYTHLTLPTICSV